MPRWSATTRAAPPSSASTSEAGPHREPVGRLPERGGRGTARRFRPTRSPRAAARLDHRHPPLESRSRGGAASRTASGALRPTISRRARARACGSGSVACHAAPHGRAGDEPLHGGRKPGPGRPFDDATVYGGPSSPPRNPGDRRNFVVALAVRFQHRRERQKLRPVRRDAASEGTSCNEAMAPRLRLLVLDLFASVVRAQELPNNAEYRLGPRDLVEIKVLEIPELNVERRVSDRGTVALPLIGDFVVTGLTTVEARTKLETLLKEKYVNRADVSDRREGLREQARDHRRARSSIRGRCTISGAGPSSRRSRPPEA